jgi:hypothetical protein
MRSLIAIHLKASRLKKWWVVNKAIFYLTSFRHNWLRWMSASCQPTTKQVDQKMVSCPEIDPLTNITK